MSVKLGSTNISKMYLGANEISKAYLGSTLVFQNTVTFTARYQAVLDYATANSIEQPSLAQNIINDRIVKNFINVGVLGETISSADELDLFYYFQQETGTPYEFLTLNWVDPTKHRLTNQGANAVSFTAGQGLSVIGGNNQYMNLNFTPSTQAVKGLGSNCGVIFKLFGVPTTYASPIRILGGEGGGFVVNLNQAAQNTLLTRFYENARNSTGTMGDINSHLQLSRNIAGSSQTIFKDGAYLKNATTTGSTSRGLPTSSLHLFGYNQNGTAIPSEGALGISYLAIGSSLIYDDNVVYNILNNQHSFEDVTPAGTLRFTTANTAGFPSLYYPKVYLSEPYKSYFSGITKDYIVLYSTNHEGTGSTAIPANGAIAWGECDTPDLVGFVDKGIIIAGYQSETPSLIINPNDPNGQDIWFFYHPGTTFPDAGGVQQTRLLTTSGGVNLHDATYTDRGKVLGLIGGELHTGYADAYVENDGSITVIHITKGWSADSLAGIPDIGKSTCPGNSYVFTRVTSDIDITSFMPYFRHLHHTPSLFFVRNSIQYAVGRNATFVIANVNIQNFIGIWQCNGSYLPTAFLGNISSVNGGSDNYNAGYFIDETNDPDTLHIYYIKSGTQMFHTTWDLRSLD